MLIQKNLLTSEESAEVIKIFDNKIAPFKKIYDHFGLNMENIVKRIKEKL